MPHEADVSAIEVIAKDRCIVSVSWDRCLRILGEMDGGDGGGAGGGEDDLHARHLKVLRTVRSPSKRMHYILYANACTQMSALK